MDGVLLRRPSFAEIRENLRLRAVGLLLGAGLLIYLAHATLFYFLKDLSLRTGGGDVGLFFTLSMVTMIAVRAFGGALFDRMNKLVVLQIGLLLLIPCFIALPHADASNGLLPAGGCVRIMSGRKPSPAYCPAFFGFPAASLRGLNTNLNLFTLDMAYFLMPYLGGMLITLGAGFEVLFYSAAGVVLLSLLLVMTVAHR